ncbi:hypothetical protein QTP86_009166 [Hemibagrus guttatus]|nr:hypothetical protein QTP86_009166 [Hemibagrus guttatus]
MQLSTVASEEVLQITQSCNPTTCPLDPIPSAMLQTISPDLLSFITTVINGSLTSGHVPTVFKKARVIPILKRPALNPSEISNYRLVSLLSFLSKILERIVCNQLSDYLMQNNFHDPNQSGFKAAHSPETALLAVTEKLHAARSAKLSSVLILLDLSAAFDTVNHKTLLSTLRSLGIFGTAWEWFASYLDGRSYQVTWKGLTSAPHRLSTGVPQGSVLGPLLFSLYTHSLDKVISSHGFSYHCYADDAQLIFSFPPSDATASAQISVCLADISSWMTAHQLKLNPSKTELLIITDDPSPAQDLEISLSNSMISPSATARNLWVTMDNQLSFSSHVTNVTRSWLVICLPALLTRACNTYKAKNGSAPPYHKALIAPRTAPAPSDLLALLDCFAPTISQGTNANAKEALCELYGAITELQNAHLNGLFIFTGDFNHVNLKSVLAKFCQYVDFAKRGTNTQDLVYTNIPGVYRAEPCPHLGYLDHISVMLIPAYRPLVRCSKPVLKQVKTWPAGAISALQDCFECTDWNMFRGAATNGDSINLEEYTTSLTSYISKCIDDVTISKTITTHSNQKPWMTAEVCALLKSRDSTIRAGDKEALRTARAKLSRAIKGAKRMHTQRIHGNFPRLPAHAAGHTGDHKLQDHTICL